MELILVRHSETQKNIEDKFDILSDTNEAFTEFGQFQLGITNDFLSTLPKKDHTIIISGARKRVVDTSIFLSKKMQIPNMIIETLSPIYSGNLAGISQHEAKIKYPELMKKRHLFSENRINGYEIIFPDGDNVIEYESKIKASLLDTLNKLNEYERIIFVTHRSTILATINIFNKLFGYQENSIYKYYETPVGSIDIVHYNSLEKPVGDIIRYGGYFNWTKKD